MTNNLVTLPEKMISSRLMRAVILAVLPATGWGFLLFGLPAVILTVSSILSILIVENIYCYLFNKQLGLQDGTAIITGLLLALSLPPNFPPLAAGFGGALGVITVKLIPGGTGKNILNPALTGRLFLHLLFFEQIFSWQQPFSYLFNQTNSLTSATPFTQFTVNQQVPGLFNLFSGLTAGSTGETSIIMILIGGLLLFFLGYLDWKIPVGTIIGGAIGAWIFFGFGLAVGGAIFQLTVGGIIIGAVFYATDPVSSPRGKFSRLIYGLTLGFSIILIRRFTIFPDGTMFAILLLNPVVPLLDHLETGRTFRKINPRKAPLTLITSAIVIFLTIFGLSGGHLSTTNLFTAELSIDQITDPPGEIEKIAVYQHRGEQLKIYQKQGPDGETDHFKFEAVGPGFEKDVKLQVKIKPDFSRLKGIEIIESGATERWERKIKEYTDKPDDWSEYGFKNWFEGLNPWPEVELIMSGPPEADNQVLSATRATVSSRGIVQAINQTLPIVKEKIRENKRKISDN